MPRTCALLAVLAVCARASADKAVIELTEANFDELTSAKPFFVEFFAPWCGHCKNLAPTWEALAAKLAEDGGAIGVGAVDATVHKDLGQRHSVRGYPTLILFKDGEMTTYKGPRELADFEKFLAGGYASLPAKPKPTPPSAASKAKAQLVALFEAIVALFETQFAAALVMTAVAFFTGITVGFAAGLILAPTPKPPKAKPAEKTE